MLSGAKLSSHLIVASVAPRQLAQTLAACQSSTYCVRSVVCESACILGIIAVSVYVRPCLLQVYRWRTTWLDLDLPKIWPKAC